METNFTITTQYSVTYTFSNATGPGLLSVTDISSLSEDNVSNVAFSTTNFDVAAGGTQDVTVTFDTGSNPGSFSFDIQIDNNDTNEGTYTFTVAGQLEAMPKIEVVSSVVGAIVDSGNDDQGTSVPVGVEQTITYTVTNIGGGTLTLGSPGAGFNSSNVDMLVDTSATVFNLGGNETTTFAIRFTTTSAGAFNFFAAFTTNDLSIDNPPYYNFEISGIAIEPEIDVQRASASIASGNDPPDALGTITAGAAQDLSYTIANTGTDTLTVSGIAVSNESNVVVDVSGFLASLPQDVDPLTGTLTLPISYTAAFDGAFSFTLTLTNTDDDEGSYAINVSGTADGAAQISVVNAAAPGVIIDPAGTDTVATAVVAATAQTISYTVSNDSDATALLVVSG